jgi:carboxypeptidase Taq
MTDSLSYIYKEQKELSLLGGIGALLGWDQMTYMPPKGIQERSDQMALLSRLSHERIISDTFYHHIQNLEQKITTLPEPDQHIIKRLKEDVDKARKIPPAFTEKLSKTTTLAYQAWEDARTHNTYKTFAPHLDHIIQLERDYTDYIKLPGPAYNSLLDDYEEGMTVDKLKTEFHTLRTHLTTILKKIEETPRYQHQKPFTDSLTLKQQQTLSAHLLKHMNLPPEETRLDVSTHPFTTTLADQDVRITTNYERDGPTFALFSTMHEAGHALYELGLPRGKFQDTVISDAPSLGIHESQSRFWENMIGRNQHFWHYFYPILQKTSPATFTTLTQEDWYRDINLVRPSPIRIEADELTYCLHVILRFELELDLIDQKITVHELPQAWNEKMRELLGITPPNDRDGVLQDMHWSGGDFGYFPTYAIGSIYSAQLYNALLKDQPTITNDLTSGNLQPILLWLREHVHQYGRLYTADEIITKACGQGLNSQVYVDYLKNKYYDIYDV